MTILTKIGYFIAFHIVNLYCKTWRYKLVNRSAYDNLRSKGVSVVMAIWHDSILPCTFLHRKEGMVTIASDSKDGSLIAYALNKWGFNTARGSSTRGGVKAALKAVKLSKENKVPCAVTVDGPKGPRHQVKDGAIFIGKKLDKVVLIGLLSCKRYKRFNSWDKFILPLPFAKITITYSEPIYLSDGIEKEDIEKDKQILQNRMLDLTNEVSPFFV